MPAQSQRPLVNKLLACEPLSVRGYVFTSIDDALLTTGVSISQLVKALRGHDIPVTYKTLRRWQTEVQEAQVSAIRRWQEDTQVSAQTADN
jgi:hypothetical protein